MLRKQAKTLSPTALRRMLAAVRRSRQPQRDRVMVLLSVRAGLRAAEIAKLTWDMVLDAQGRVAPAIDIRSSIAKRGAGRRVPMHPQLKRALATLRRTLGAELTGPGCPVIRSARGRAMRPNSIVNWFSALFRELDLDGCSSHSGRRTFITNAARNAHRVGACLRDVQILAGHRSIETTQAYIEGDTAAQRRLVGLV
jgi:integrase/recombinase XerD